MTLKKMLEQLCRQHDNCPYLLRKQLPDWYFDVLNTVKRPDGWRQSCKCTVFPGV
jgi:hypothetical protein